MFSRDSFKENILSIACTMGESLSILIAKYDKEAHIDTTSFFALTPFANRSTSCCPLPEKAAGCKE